jgi:hypothetical protein
MGENQTQPYSSSKTGSCQPLGEQKHLLRCAINETTKNKLLRLAELLGFDNPVENLEALIDYACELALEAKDPKRRSERKQKKQTKNHLAQSREFVTVAQPPKNQPQETEDPVDQLAPAPKNQPQETEAPIDQLKKSFLAGKQSSAGKQSPVGKQSSAGKPSRYIPSLLKQKVLERAGFCCEYVSLTGRQCGQRIHLEVDHKHPLSLGGGTSELNLQVLCSAHHKLKSEIEQGYWK